MDKKVLVSIVMPTYNCAPFISEAIESVIAQSLNDWEIQIVDDGSTDNTSEVIQPLLRQYPQIHYTVFSENRGADAARTEAICRAQGQYIAFLDSDDVWMPDKLEKQIAFMQQNHVAFSCTAYEQIDETGESLGKTLYPPQKTDYRKMLRLANPIGNLTVIYDQDALGKYVVPQLTKRNDFALWLQILHDTKFCFGMQDVLAKYRVRKNSIGSKKLQLFRFYWELYRNIENLSILKSFWYICCCIVAKVLGIGTKKKHNYIVKKL